LIKQRAFEVAAILAGWQPVYSGSSPGRSIIINIMNILFWCEFPEKIDWDKLNAFFRENEFIARIGIVCSSREDYDNKQEKIDNLSNIRLVKAWPVLSQEKGYWFSSQTSKEDIDSLDQYKGLKIKLDIEPPLPSTRSYFKMVLWLFKELFKKGKNKEYLEEKIRSFDGDVMLSTFPFPKFVLKRMGMVYDKSFEYNYIFYTSFIPKLFRPLYRLYYRGFIKRRLKFNSSTSFAVGLLSSGIFGNEPVYSTVEEFRKDLKFLKNNNVNNIVVFRLGSFPEKGKEWLDAIKFL